MSGKLKVAVIGTGHLGSIHARLWKRVENVELTGIFDIDIDIANSLSNELGCQTFNSIKELALNSDAVTIAAPTTLHFEIAKECIELGKHCFIEKPITQTYEQATELIELSKKQNVILQVGHVERFNPALLALKSYQISPMFIEAHRLSQFKPRAIDVSVIHDLMIHDIDIMLWLVKSKVVSIDANGVQVLTNTPDIANARIKFENACVANITASRISAHPMRKMRIFQNNAYISMDFGNQEVDVYRILSDDEPIEQKSPATMLGTLEAGLKNKKIVYEKPAVPEMNAILEEQRSFANAIVSNNKVAVTAEEATEALRIAEEINQQVERYMAK
jgi:predicted dehydrogenase